MSDLRKLKEQKSAQEMKESLQLMRKRLDDPNVLCGEVIVDMLFCFRDIQAYDEMIHLVEELRNVPIAKKYMKSYIMYLYAFALNRRRKEGDRERALNVCIDALKIVSISNYFQLVIYNIFNTFRKKIIFLTCCVCVEEYTKISSQNLVIWIKKVWTKLFIGIEKDLKSSLTNMQVHIFL